MVKISKIVINKKIKTTVYFYKKTNKIEKKSVWANMNKK